MKTFAEPHATNKMTNENNPWYCIGQSGPTADGRHIEADALTQAAAAYDPNTYAARINIEHFRPFFPGSGLGGLGDVTALKAEAENGAVKLYARLNLTEKALSILQSKEKIYTSMEIIKNFADTGKAYLVGLALTDSPASLGTTPLKYTSEPSLLTTDFSELILMNTETRQQSDNSASKKTGLFAALAAAFKTPVQPEPAPAAETQPEDFAARLGELEAELKHAAEVVQTLIEENEAAAAAFAVLQNEFKQFKADIEAQAINSKAPHTGAALAAQSDF